MTSLLRGVSHHRAGTSSPLNTHLQKRHTHNTKSYEYIQQFVKDQKHFNQLENLAKHTNLIDFPKTVTTLLKAESAFTDQGLVAAVHATPAAFTPAIHIATKCELVKNKSTVHKDISTFAVLRDPGSLSDHYTQMMHILQALNDPTNPYPDHLPLMSDRVLSMNYGLLTNIEMGESAFYFGFRNWSGKGGADPDFAINKAKTMTEKTLKHYGYSEQNIKDILDSTEFNKLLADFHSLRTGNLLAFGIPREIAQKHLYDSRRYGVPTGDDVLKVYDGTEGRNRITEHQARLVLSKETMHPDSGIVVLSALDEQDAVDPYLMKNKEKAFIPPFEHKEFSAILPVASTPIEKEEIEKRKALLGRSRVFAGSVAAML